MSNFKIGDIVKVAFNCAGLYLKGQQYYKILDVHSDASDASKHIRAVVVKTLNYGIQQIEPRRFEKVSEKDITKLELLIYLNE